MGTSRLVMAAGGILAMFVVMFSATPERAALICTGGAAWIVLGAHLRTRIAEPVGAWAVLVGAAWLVGRLDDAVVASAYTVGNVLSLAAVPAGMAVFIGFPSGRLVDSPLARDPRTDTVHPGRLRMLRSLVVAALLAAVPLGIWVVLGGETDPLCPECDRRVHTLTDAPGLAHALQLAQIVVIVAALGATAVCFEAAFRAQPGPHRRAHAPVRIGLVVTVGVATVHLVTVRAGLAWPARATLHMGETAVIVLPFMLGLGLHREREADQTVLTRLRDAPAATVDAVESVLREVLEAPELRVERVPADGVGTPARRRQEVRDAGGRRVVVISGAPGRPGSRLMHEVAEWTAGRLTGDDDRAMAARVAALSDAELITALALADHRTNREIAADLFLAVGTVSNRVSRVYRVLDLSHLSRRDRPALIARLRPVIEAEMRARGIGSG